MHQRFHSGDSTEKLMEFGGEYVALFEQMTGTELEKLDPPVSARDRIRAR
ncbi:hypothetical protein GCM10022267_91430 [Lentzea roselyniae]|uniref:Uncharacterized protein n=1 Tax=Lentzea roselyniae TaxID=531940 RepID=A0ABP7CLE8_9PSEU